MVAISFGKSNFSKAQNSYQMTISLIMMVIMMCAVSSLITMAKMNESSSSKLEPVPIKKQDTEPEDVAVRKELVKAVEDLETPESSVEKPSGSVKKPPAYAYIRFYEKCSEKPVTSIKIDRNTLSEDVVNGQLISEPGQKIRRIELGNITILGTSEYTRYKKDVPDIEDVGEEWRPITCFNGGCEKLATVKVLGDPYYDDDSVFLLDGNCNSPTDYYKNIKFNYEITRG